jgi:hypothetical protein
MMKNKPIKEGYKFFALCDSQSGFVYKFFPDGRNEKYTIQENVECLLDSIPGTEERRFIVAMDNYFTQPSTMAASREYNVGVFGTARKRFGFPPKEMLDIDDGRFNTLYLMKDEGNFLIGRWVDNNVVHMVSTCHTGLDTVKKERKRPRPNKILTKGMLKEIWGDDYRKEVWIPTMIDDYNKHMGGVDKADQMISYYRPNIRCRRTWMPLLFHCFDIQRINSYIIHKYKTPEKDRFNHKEYVGAMITALLLRADAERKEGSATRKRKADVLTPSSIDSPIRKRQRYNKNDP